MKKKVFGCRGRREYRRASASVSEKDGFEVLIASDGGKGVELFESFEPELVLLDIMLPVLSGWQVCEKIRAKSKAPIIMLTAKGETFDKVTGLEMGG
jgi:DNA-binding response OmpR family regulator